MKKAAFSESGFSFILEIIFITAEFLRAGEFLLAAPEDDQSQYQEDEGVGTPKEAHKTSSSVLAYG